MSTDYFRLRKPFTSVRVTEMGAQHKELALWVNHARAGHLTLRNEEVAVLLGLRRDESACTRHAGHPDYLSYNDDDLELDTVLISESGELTTLQILKDEGTDIDT